MVLLVMKMWDDLDGGFGFGRATARVKRGGFRDGCQRYDNGEELKSMFSCEDAGCRRRERNVCRTR